MVKLTIQIDDLWFALFDSEEKIIAFTCGISIFIFASLLTVFCINLVHLVDALIRRYIWPGKNQQPSDQNSI